MSEPTNYDYLELHQIATNYFAHMARISEGAALTLASRFGCYWEWRTFYGWELHDNTPMAPALAVRFLVEEGLMTEDEAVDFVPDDWTDVNCFKWTYIDGVKNFGMSPRTALEFAQAMAKYRYEWGVIDKDLYYQAAETFRAA